MEINTNWFEFSSCECNHQHTCFWCMELRERLDAAQAKLNQHRNHEQIIDAALKSCLSIEEEEEEDYTIGDFFNIAETEEFLDDSDSSEVSEDEDVVYCKVDMADFYELSDEVDEWSDSSEDCDELDLELELESSFYFQPIDHVMSC